MEIFKKNGTRMGLEPMTLGTTNRCSNQLSYNLRFKIATQKYKIILLSEIF